MLKRDGPDGEEIYCDDHGRVKLQFPWDCDGSSNDHRSCCGWGQIGREKKPLGTRGHKCSCMFRCNVESTSVLPYQNIPLPTDAQLNATRNSLNADWPGAQIGGKKKAMPQLRVASGASCKQHGISISLP